MTCDLKDVPLRIGLTAMLRPLGLEAIVQNELLLITNVARAECVLKLRLYDVTDLLGPPEERRQRLDAWEEMIPDLLYPQSWGNVGGPGAIASWSAQDRCLLVISQTRSVHEEIARLLTDLRALKAKDAVRGAAPRTPSENFTVKIEEALRRPTDLCFDKCSLDKAIASLARECRIPIRFNTEALRWKKIDPQMPVTVSEKGKSLGDALTAWLDPLDMAWRIRANTVMITLSGDDEEDCFTIVYDVTELVSLAGKAADNLARLNDTIQNAVDCCAWENVGGPGGIVRFCLDDRYLLLVRQTDKTHTAVRTFLAAVRKMDRKEAGAANTFGGRSAELDARVRKTLDKPISVEFSQTPIHAALMRLEKEAGLPFRFDKLTRKYGPPRGMAGMGEVTLVPIDQDTPITQQFEKVKLAQALDQLLKPTDLDWDIDGEMIRITRPEALGGVFFSRMYDLADMPAYRDEQGRGVPDLDGITVAIEESFFPEARGSSYAVQPIRFGNAQALVIQQTWRGHEEIAAFLAELHKDFKKVAPEDIAKLPPLPKESDAWNGPPQEEEESAVDPETIGPDPLGEGIQWRQAATDNAAFAVDLYKQLSGKQQGNLFFSPWSLSSAMAMAYAGARGNTAAEMAKVMRFSLSAEELHAAMAALGKSADRDAKANRYQLHVGNRLWAQQDYPLLEDFTQVLRRAYDAEAGRVDFGKPNEAAQAINAWVAKQTAGKIRNVVDPAALKPETRMILVNAAFFKAEWEDPFYPLHTQKQQFFTNKGVVMAQLMRLDAEHRYAEADDIQILEKPYRGGSVAMLILLPSKEPGAMERLEKMFSSDKLDAWTAKLAKRDTILFLPQFKSESTFDFAAVLAEMGMPSALDRDGHADFSGATAKKDLYLDQITQKATIDVYEKGTVAAVITSMGMGGIGGYSEPPPPPVIFRADHPFLYLIRDTRTGNILFMGRLATPVE